jgi:outer membrane lipoprotein
MKRMLLAVLALLLGGGCAHVLSQESLGTADPTLEFAAVKADPIAFKGRTLVLGGMIVDTRPTREGTTLEILNYSLDRWGEPQQADEAGGRFLARTDRFLDPELYKPGLFITLTGTAAGQQTRELAGVPYAYPVFRIGEAYVWRRPAASYGYYPYPYYPYGPYYDPWWPYPYYDPFWYDPFWPRPYRFAPPGRRLK